MSTLFIKYSAIPKERWPSLPATNKGMYKTVVALGNKQTIGLLPVYSIYGTHGTLRNIVTDW